MKYYFIMNPGSQRGKSQKRFATIHELLRRSNIEYDYAITQSLEHAYDLSVTANQSGYDVIAAIGGDGTINRVINGFYASDGVRISSARFGVVYTGTSPDFCKSYHIPLEINKAVQTLIKGYTRKVGIGRIEFQDRVKYFACCANIGLGATLSRYANSGIRKIFGDTVGTFLSLLKTLVVFKPISIKVNGLVVNHVYNLSIGKTLYIASGLKIKNILKNKDLRFYILTAQRKIGRLMLSMYLGKNLELTYATEIFIEGTGEVEFDGDEGGTLPCRINSASYLELICEESYE